MKLTRRLGFLMLAGILASCTACGSETPPVPVEESTQEETDNMLAVLKKHQFWKVKKILILRN